MDLPAAPASLDRAASWSWRVLVCAAALLALLVALAVVAGLIAIVTTSVAAQYDQLVDSVSRAVGDITDRLEGEPFNLSVAGAGDLEASLADSWREASGYAAAGVQAGAGLLAGLVLAVAVDGGWEIGLATLAIVLAVQFVEGNFLQPIIQSRTVDLHPLVILLAVAAGASLFGILGAFLAVPVTAVVFAVVASLGSDAPAPGAVPADAGSSP